MKTIRLFSFAALITSFFAPVLAQPAHAQVTLDRFQSAETVYDGFAVSRPNDRGHLKFGAHLTVDYGNDPLVYETRVGSKSSERQSVVQDEVVGALSLSLGLANRLVLFGGVPVVLVMSGDDATTAVPLEADGAGVGDPWIGARFRLLGENKDMFGAAVQAALTFPVANAADDSQLFRGEDGFTFAPKLLLELRPGIFRFTGNAGILVRKEQGGGGLAIGNEFRWALGVTVDLVRDRLTGHIEAYGASPLGEITKGVSFGDRESSPLEGIAGLKYYSPKGVVLGLAGGPGFLRGYGSPDFRLVAQLGFGAREGEPAQERAVEQDTDGDGIYDVNDACPTDPEDRDDFEDADGCPDPDNDQDGVLDVDDKCINEPEDKDGFEDANGCPDPDNDQDGILDGVDQCMNEAEDKDGFEDENGCPDPDNDQDSVLDTEDACPTAPGAASEKREENGCPKAVRVEDGRIVILQRVEFATNKDVILKTSNDLLLEVGATIRANQQMKRIRVVGHTDDRGNDAKNLDLSKRRAASVARWLIASGIEEGRLEAYGCGETRPVADNRTNEGRQTNRRVEFNIVDPAPPGDVDAMNGCEAISVSK